MAKTNNNSEFEEQLKGERKFYRGFLADNDFVPGSKVTVAEARENHKKNVEAFEAKKAERKAQVLAKKKPVVETTVVTPGVIATVEITNDISKQVALPSDEDLKKLSTAELISLATNRGVEVKANVDTESAIIAKLKGVYTDAKFATLTGKSREVLDSYAIELGIAKTPEELKEKFANAELLAKAINTARK